MIPSQNHYADHPSEGSGEFLIHATEATTSQRRYPGGTTLSTKDEDHGGTDGHAQRNNSGMDTYDATPSQPALGIDDAIERLGMGPFQLRILVASGLCFAADAMEVLLLSFLAVVLQYEWHLTPDKTATITSVVFIGATVGTLMLGPLGDCIGRKPVFTLTAAIICFFGFATAAAKSYGIFLFLRFMVGFGVGGLVVPFSVLAEFVPTSYRGTNLMAIEYFWTGGTLLVPVLAYFSLGNGGQQHGVQGWPFFVILCGIPCLISTVLGVMLVPESPRWLLTRKKHNKALSILRKAAQINGKDPALVYPADTTLADQTEEESSTRCCDLFAPQWRKITVLMWTTWAGMAIVYYGTIMAVTLAFSNSNDQNGNSSSNATTYSFDYWAIFTSASSEIAGTTLALLVIDRIGRVRTQVISYLGGGISVLALCLLSSQGQDAMRSLKILAAFLARMFFMSASCSTWVHTSELLPTEIRTTGHSASNALARIGGSFSPYLVSTATPFPVIGITLFSLSLLTAFSSCNLPETMGKAMGVAHTQVPETELTSGSSGSFLLT